MGPRLVGIDSSKSWANVSSGTVLRDLVERGGRLVLRGGGVLLLLRDERGVFALHDMMDGGVVSEEIVGSGVNASVKKASTASQCVASSWFISSKRC